MCCDYSQGPLPLSSLFSCYMLPSCSSFTGWLWKLTLTSCFNNPFIFTMVFLLKEYRIAFMPQTNHPGHSPSVNTFSSFTHNITTSVAPCHIRECSTVPATGIWMFLSIPVLPFLFPDFQALDFTSEPWKKACFSGAGNCVRVGVCAYVHTHLNYFTHVFCCVLYAHVYDLISVMSFQQLKEQGPSHTSMRTGFHRESSPLGSLCFPFCQLGVSQEKSVS